MRSPQEAAAAWVAGMQGAGAKATSGAQGVTVPPGQAAARNKAGYVQGVTSNVDKWAANVAKVSTADWASAYINKGVPRMGTGASAAEGKMATFLTKFLPVVASAKGSLPPRGNFQQNMARLNQFLTALHGFKNS